MPGSGDHDLDQRFARLERRAAADADRRLACVHPLAPGRVVLVVKREVGEPHFCGKQTRLVDARVREQPVDALEDGARLRAGPSARLRSAAADGDQAAPLEGAGLRHHAAERRSMREVLVGWLVGWRWSRASKSLAKSLAKARPR